MCQRNHSLGRLLYGLFIGFIGIVLLPGLTEAKPDAKVLSLQAEVDAILERYSIPRDTISIDALYLNSGLPLFQLNPQKALIPASTMKVLTTVAALETFGTQHRYPTELYSSAEKPQRTLPDLWIKGYGSPFLVSEEMNLIAKTLRQWGVRTIDGPIYVDDTYFGPASPIRYAGTTGKSMYRVVTGALSYNFNRPEALLSKARQYKRQSPRFKKVSGVPGRTPLLNKKVLDPSIYTGMALRDALRRHGIQVTGDVLYRPVEPEATLILHHASRNMGEVLTGLNKESSNFIAEQVLRSLAAARYGVASRESGLMVLAETIKTSGTESVSYALDNASGLSRANRLASVHLTALLRHALQAPYGETFARTLSIAGVDGTLRRRFHGSALRGHLWAKTGSLFQVSALAGYTLAGEEPIAFAILINDYNVSPHQVQRAEEKIIELLVEWATEGDIS